MIQRSVNQTSLSHDYGLRAIKAIIGIAEQLKLQYLGLEDCELAYMLDEETLKKLPFREDAEEDPETRMITEFIDNVRSREQ